MAAPAKKRDIVQNLREKRDDEEDHDSSVCEDDGDEQVSACDLHFARYIAINAERANLLRLGDHAVPLSGLATCSKFLVN